MKNNIKVQRAIKDLTQQDLAILAKVSRQTISAMEKGKYVPSTLLALRLSSIFKKPVNEIFQLEDEDWEK